MSHKITANEIKVAVFKDFTLKILKNVPSMQIVIKLFEM